MYIKFILKILSFFDYFKKKDVIIFFKKNITGDIINLIDVGAHHGETIKLFNSSSLPYAANLICPLASKYVVDTSGTEVLFLTQ